MQGETGESFYNLFCCQLNHHAICEHLHLLACETCCSISTRRYHAPVIISWAHEGLGQEHPVLLCLLRFHCKSFCFSEALGLCQVFWTRRRNKLLSCKHRSVQRSASSQRYAGQSPTLAQTVIAQLQGMPPFPILVAACCKATYLPPQQHYMPLLLVISVLLCLHNKYRLCAK